MTGAPPDSQPSPSQEHPPPTREELCRSTARRLRAAHGWTLLDDDALAALALAAAPPDAGPAAIEALARDRYSRELWSACRPSAAAPRREAAYADLQRYLYRAAYNRRPAAAEECAQRALELVLAQVERCREPGAFLTFALNKLRHALREAADDERRRQPAHPPPEAATPPDAVHADAEARALAAALLAALGRLRDARQRQVVVLKFFGGLDDQAIAARLEITPNHVRVLRHHAMTRLRADEDLAGWRRGAP